MSEWLLPLHANGGSHTSISRWVKTSTNVGEVLASSVCMEGHHLGMGARDTVSLDSHQNSSFSFNRDINWQHSSVTGIGITLALYKEN